MEADREDALWTTLLPAALVLLCCGGPVLVAAASAGMFVTMAVGLEAYRPYLVATAAVLAGVAVYAARRPPAACCRVTTGARAVCGAWASPPGSARSSWPSWRASRCWSTTVSIPCRAEATTRG